MADNNQNSAYKEAGVDIVAGEEAVKAIKLDVESTYTAAVVGSIGGFGGLFSIAEAKDMIDPLLVSGTDGVGTKLELAQRSGVYNTVGIDLVAMCANDIICTGAKPLFFLDYLAMGKLDPAVVALIVEGVAAGCREAGCALVGGEMAEHPGTMAVKDFDLSGFCVGIVDRPKMLGPDSVEAGDAIIGLASSGFHSNGFSLVRSVLTNKMTDAELTSERLESGQLLIEALLEPTYIYVLPLLSALEAKLGIKAVANITGGGITNNLNRALPLGLNAQIRLGSWVIPPIIDYFNDIAKIEEDDLLQTFNMGIGFAIICKQADVEALLEHFEQYDATVIGEVLQAESPETPGGVSYLK